MLQEAADDRFDADVVRNTRHAWTQTANAADDQVDLYAGLAGLVELADNLRVDQGVELGPNLRRLARLSVQNFLVNQMHKAKFQRHR